MDYENTTRVASKKTTTEFICGHPNWCHRVMEWQVPVHLQDLAGSGKYIGASAVQGRKMCIRDRGRGTAGWPTG